VNGQARPTAAVGAQVSVIREGNGSSNTDAILDSLKTFQDERAKCWRVRVRVHLANFDDVKVGDVLEAFEHRQSTNGTRTRRRQRPIRSPRRVCRISVPVNGQRLCRRVTCELHFPEDTFAALKEKRQYRRLSERRSCRPRRRGRADVDHQDSGSAPDHRLPALEREATRG